MITPEHRAMLLRVIFGWILLALLWRWHDGAMLSQLEAPVLGNVYKDFTFWGFELLGLTSLLTAPGWSLAFDLTLTASVILALILPRGVVFPRIYCAAILVYFIVHTTYANHHFRPIIGLVLAGTPFMFRIPRARTMFEAVRYYLLFLYSSAGLYKIFRGSWLNSDQMTGIIENTQLELLLLHPDGWHAHFFIWLLQHQWASWGLFVLATLMETVFLIGYFTKRWDLWLFITAISLHIGFYFTMRFFAFELIVLDLTLLPWERILRRKEQQRIAPELQQL